MGKTDFSMGQKKMAKGVKNLVGIIYGIECVDSFAMMMMMTKYPDDIDIAKSSVTISSAHHADDDDDHSSSPYNTCQSGTTKLTKDARILK